MAAWGKIALPAIALGLIAWGLGGKKKNGAPKAPPEYEEYPEGEGEPRPESDRMLFDDGCNELIVRVRSANYDARITEAYWQLRSQGFEDPFAIAVEILKMDAPQCTWPPTAESSLRSKRVWELIYPAVESYFGMEQAGTLGDYASVFGTDEEFIE